MPHYCILSNWKIKNVNLIDFHLIGVTAESEMEVNWILPEDSFMISTLLVDVILATVKINKKKIMLPALGNAHKVISLLLLDSYSKAKFLPEGELC